jgi:hypothetical protein
MHARLETMEKGQKEMAETMEKGQKEMAVKQEEIMTKQAEMEKRQKSQ